MVKKPDICSQDFRGSANFGSDKFRKWLWACGYNEMDEKVLEERGLRTEKADVE